MQSLVKNNSFALKKNSLIGGYLRCLCKILSWQISGTSIRLYQILSCFSSIIDNFYLKSQKTKVFLPVKIFFERRNPLKLSGFLSRKAMFLVVKTSFFGKHERPTKTKESSFCNALLEVLQLTSNEIWFKM